VDATTVVALAGLGTTAAVGLAAPLITRRAERERFDREIRQSKLDELRTVTERAALELLEGHDLHVQAMGAIKKWAAVEGTSDLSQARAAALDPYPQVAAFSAHVVAMLQARYRLALRLGSRDSIVVAYQEAVEPLEQTLAVLNAMSDDPSVVRDRMEELDPLGAKAGERAGGFLDACSAVFRP
jgi:hypothetical protein